ncbi:transposase family protein|nr:transposase family protein [Stenotrophomonas sp. SbOxS2]
MHELQLRACFERAALTGPQREHLLAMIAETPSRRPGGAALNNVIAQFWSDKNRAPIWIESHTVERLFAYELELDPTVLAYYSQIPCRGIERRNANGRRHLGNATADFLVIRADSVTVVECKAAQRIESLLQQKPLEWVRSDDGVVERPALSSWASAWGLNYAVWVQPSLFACLLANLELLCSVKPPDEPGKVHRQALRQLERSSLTIGELIRRVSGLTPLAIHQLLRMGLVCGTIKSQPIALTETFRLFLDPQQCRAAEADAAQFVDGRLRQPSGPIATASYRDLCAGRQRLETLRAMRRGDRPFTRWYRDLDRLVHQAVLDGMAELEPCLTNFRRSGNRSGRLGTVQKLAVDLAVRRWEAGKTHSRGHAYAEHVAHCQDASCAPVSRTTLYRKLSAANASKRALLTGGLREYQKQREVTDPRHRSIASLAFGLRIHIDSTQIDARVFPGVEDKLLLDRPIIYVAVDNATGLPICYELGFGPARSDALAALLRTYVRTTGSLPNIIQLDRGAENRSNWLAAFCREYHITLMIHPTGASVFNSAAENWLGRINSRLHSLPGSTLPDKKGRYVDGRFKSRQTARLQFSALHEVVHDAIELLRDVPGADGESPIERKARLIDETGIAGHAVEIDDNFLFHSSIPTRASALDPKRGIKTERTRYASSELLQAARRGDVIEVRRDCEDPTVMHVQMSSGRCKAWSGMANKVAGLPDIELKFLAYYLHQRGSKVVERRLDAHVSHHRKVQEVLTTNDSNASQQKPSASKATRRSTKDRSASRSISVSLEGLDDYGQELREGGRDAI